LGPEGVWVAPGTHACDGRPIGYERTGVGRSLNDLRLQRVKVHTLPDGRGVELEALDVGPTKGRRP
jgi:hypothetical protein